MAGEAISNVFEGFLSLGSVDSGRSNKIEVIRAQIVVDCTTDAIGSEVELVSRLWDIEGVDNDAGDIEDIDISKSGKCYVMLGSAV